MSSLEIDLGKRVGPWHLPFFGRFGRGRCFYGLGYTGNGVAPSELAGRIMAALVLGHENAWSALRLARYEPLRYPPEPLRSLGGWLVNHAVVRRDLQEERYGRTGRLTDFAARLPAKRGYKLSPG